MIFFTKMQGTKNDFVVIDCINQKFNYSYNILSKFLCDRNIGIGADGVIFIFKSNISDYKMRIFNKDGTEAGMCGNGIRCMAKYIYENLEQKKELKIETNAGIKKVLINLENNKIKDICVNLGKIETNINKIPVYLPIISNVKEISSVKINIDKREFEVYLVGIGNPHAVCFVDDLDSLDIKKYGSIIENYKYFPNKTNVEFVKIIDKKRIIIRVWERGVGETLSCGTGSACSGFVAMKKFSLNNNLTVELKGGNLQIMIDDEKNIFLTGPAEKVFEGKIDL